MRIPQMVNGLGLAIALVTLGSAADLPGVSLGRARPTWSDLPGTDGKNHSLAELADREVVVVAISCNHCPIAIEYFDRMKEFATKHCGVKGKVGLVAISLSNLETDKLPRMQEIAEQKAFNFQYLHDKTQRIGKDLGATVTPQFFVLNRDRVLVYRGAWDDDVNASEVKSKYVEDVVSSLLAGKPPAVQETKARGCLIDYQ